MGCDIHSFCEIQKDDGSWEMIYDDPFDYRGYGLFAFLADVRNYSAVPPLSPPRGWPKDCSRTLEELDNECYWHTPSWYMIKELLDFNYDNGFEDRRCNGETIPKGKGSVVSFRMFLGPCYFNILEKLKSLGDPGRVRVVFAFDN
jgi:hypothetical protein